MLFHLAIIYRPDPALFYVSKPLVLISLLLFFLSKVEKLPNTTKWLVTIALAFSLAGDIFLMKFQFDFFLAGVGCFGLAHVFYALFFNRRRQGDFHIPSLLINIVFVGLLIFSLNEFTELPKDLVLPVNIYGGLLGLNLIASVQFNFSNKLSNYWLPLGVLLFVISDYMLALDRFNGLPKIYEYLVFSSYAAAQYLIVVGVLKHYKVLGEKSLDQNGSTT